jgi:uncharacterized repeat protein (TIGR01451 family)
MVARFRRGANMKIKFTIFALGIFLVISSLGLVLSLNAVQAQTAAYYVSPTGLDTNPGTESQPFRTIQKAASVVNASNTVIVEDGIYTGSNSCAGTVAVVCLSRGGAAGQLITFKARNKGGAKIDGQKTSNEGFYFLSNANYLRIDGFEVYGINAIAPTGGASAIALYNGGHHSEIINNTIHTVGAICTDTDKGQNGIFIQQPNVLVEGNIIRNIGRYGNGDNGCQNTTANWEAHDHGIYLNGATDSTLITGADTALIKNNIFANNNRGWSIQIYPGDLDGVVIANNSFHGTNPNRDGHITVATILRNSKISNNIFSQPRNSAISTGSASPTNVTLANNLTTATKMTNTTNSGFIQSNNYLSTDPLFVNAGTNDYHLQSTSPAKDTGITITEVTVDFDKNSRPQGPAYDIGAFEFTTITVPSPTPTPADSPNLTITKAVDKVTATPGEVLTYTITFSNTGTIDATNLVLSDPLPSGTTYVANSATMNGTFTSNTVTWSIGTVAPGSNGTVTFQVIVN